MLKDNLRVPSGVSYMLACRAAMKQAYPRLYRAHGVREIAQYPEDLYATLASLGSWGRNPRVAVLTPGRYNSAYYEHAIENLVVKEVGGSGGYGMLVGCHASRAEREAFVAQLRANPANYISQPVLALSRAGCFVDGRLEPRHVDLRPFVLRGSDEIRIAPGGLCRVALRKGGPVVNSSQGGGCKDLWILRGEEEAR